MVRTVLITLILVQQVLLSYGQTERMARWNRDLMVHAGGGIATYYGEMVNRGDLKRPRVALSIGAEYYLSPFFSTRVGLSWFQLEGNDADAKDSRQLRNLSFRSNAAEFSTIGVFNLFNQGLKFYDRARINFHAFAGVGLLYFNPKAKYNGTWYDLQPLQTEGRSYSRFQPVIPFGLGTRIKVSHYVNVLIEGAYRTTFTDYLDDVSSSRYPNPATLKSDLARALADRRGELGSNPNEMPDLRGNPARDDGYFMATVSIQYYLPMELNKNARKDAYYRSVRYKNRKGNPKSTGQGWR